MAVIFEWRWLEIAVHISFFMQKVYRINEDRWSWGTLLHCGRGYQTLDLKSVSGSCSRLPEYHCRALCRRGLQGILVCLSGKKHCGETIVGLFCNFGILHHSCGEEPLGVCPIKHVNVWLEIYPFFLGLVGHKRYLRTNTERLELVAWILIAPSLTWRKFFLQSYLWLARPSPILALGREIKMSVLFISLMFSPTYFALNSCYVSAELSISDIGSC